MMNNKLSVLIPTRNRAADLRQALEKMKDCGLHELKYIVYDDASDNVEETEVAARVIGDVTVLKGKSRLGQAGGRNHLLRACQTPYALFMDDDTWFTDASPLARIIASDLEYAGIGRASVVCSQVFRTSDGETIFSKGLETCRVVNPLGAGCIVRVEDIVKVGAFREYWRYRHEETELGLRLWKHDFQVVYDASLVVEHCHTSAARSSREYGRNSARNLILMHALNLPGFSGFPLGVLRALRLLLVREYSKTAILSGVVEGIADTLKYKDDVNAMTPDQYRALTAFRSVLQGKIRAL